MNITTYNASAICRDFHKSPAFVRLLIGPIGSGKSVASCIELFKLANLQAADSNGIRRTRWAVIRNTYRELIDTTCKTWHDWFPKDMGHWSVGHMTHRIITRNPDGTTTDMELLFRALDKPADIKKLLSLELTGGWINEAREIPKAIVDALIGRVGRFPPVKDGTPATRHCVIMDTNPPDEDHWIYRIFEEGESSMPQSMLDDLTLEQRLRLQSADMSWEKFHQPSGLSATAENLANLPENYYLAMMPGKDPEWIKVYVHGQYGFVSDGLPVYPEFHDHLHVSKLPIDFNSDILYIGVDFGRTPAAVFAQEINGQIQVIDELVTFGIGASHFSKLLSERIRGHYPNAEVVATGDPAGDNPGEQIDETCIDILQNAGIPIDPAHTNNFTLRRESVATSLTSLNMQGEPNLIISPSCTNLRKACNGGYRYKRMQVSGAETFQNKPDKNKHSHVAEALQYLCLGMGRGYDVISSNSNVGQYSVQRAL